MPLTTRVVRAEVMRRGLRESTRGSSLSVMRNTRFVAGIGVIQNVLLNTTQGRCWCSQYPSRRTQLQLVNRSPTGICLSVEGYSTLRRPGSSCASKEKILNGMENTIKVVANRQ